MTVAAWHCRQPEGQEHAAPDLGEHRFPGEASSRAEAGPSSARPDAGRTSSSADKPARKLTGGLSMFLKGLQPSGASQGCATLPAWTSSITLPTPVW